MRGSLRSFEFTLQGKISQFKQVRMRLGSALTILFVVAPSSALPGDVAQFFSEMIPEPRAPASLVEGVSRRAPRSYCCWMQSGWSDPEEADEALLPCSEGASCPEFGEAGCVAVPVLAASAGASSAIAWGVTATSAEATMRRRILCMMHPFSIRNLSVGKCARW